MVERIKKFHATGNVGKLNQNKNKQFNFSFFFSALLVKPYPKLTITMLSGQFGLRRCAHWLRRSVIAERYVVYRHGALRTTRVCPPLAVRRPIWFLHFRSVKGLPVKLKGSLYLVTIE